MDELRSIWIWESIKQALEERDLYYEFIVSSQTTVCLPELDICFTNLTDLGKFLEAFNMGISFAGDNGLV